jgi:hypothetical protein
MKKLIYLLLALTLTTATFSSCTDEEVKPNCGCTAGGSPIKE